MDTGIVIRCMYNNQGWKAACIRPGEDPECERCFNSRLQIDPPQREDKICSGNCWERYLATDYKWGCYPKGNTFSRAYKGMKAYLVFKNSLGYYTIWGTTRVASIDKDSMQSENDWEDGFKFIHFEPFEQLQRDKWVSGLSDIKLVGASWRQGRFRYIESEKVQYLDSLINGEAPEESNRITVTPPTVSSNILKLEVSPNIIERLDKYAIHEGRQRDDLIREAIAEWLKDREG